MGQDVADTVIQPIKKRNLFVDFLAILFGISSWIGVTSTYLQLPLLIQTVPEGWKLASYIVVAVQLANIGSFAYVLYQNYSPKKVDDGFLIYITLAIGCIAAICMAFFYEHTVYVNGELHSVPMLVFTLMFALVGCMSSVLFMPYMGRFRECYLVSYMFGMGLNGFVSSVLALIQGVGGTPECVEDENGELHEVYPLPRFGVRLYFELVFCILVLSSIAFVLLNNLKTCKKEYAAGKIGAGNEYQYDDNKEINDNQNQSVPNDVLNLSKFNYIFLLAAIFGLSGLGNGLLPAVVTYSCVPYGNVVYHFATTLAAIANPCGGFIAMFLPHTSIRVIRFLSAIGLALATYIIYIAVQSPNPPFKDSTFGKMLIVSIAKYIFQLLFMQMIEINANLLLFLFHFRLFHGPLLPVS